jgi:hypothetical protein
MFKNDKIRENVIQGCIGTLGPNCKKTGCNIQYNKTECAVEETANNSILIVDDEPFNHVFLSRILGSEYFIYAGNAKVAAIKFEVGKCRNGETDTLALPPSKNIVLLRF